MTRVDSQELASQPSSVDRPPARIRRSVTGRGWLRSPRSLVAGSAEASSARCGLDGAG